jgi:hypothetical protein
MGAGNQSNYARQRELLLNSFSQGTPSGDVHLEEATVIELIVNLLCLQADRDPNDANVRESVRAWARTKMHSFDPDNPELAHSAKLLRLLGRSNLGDMLNYAENLSKTRVIKEGQRQASRARTPRKPDGLNQILHRLVKNDPSISKSEVLASLRDQEGNGVILEVDDELIEYYPTGGPDSKTVTVSGLDTRLTKIRKKFR